MRRPLVRPVPSNPTGARHAFNNFGSGHLTACPPTGHFAMLASRSPRHQRTSGSCPPREDPVLMSCQIHLQKRADLFDVDAPESQLVRSRETIQTLGWLRGDRDKVAATRRNRSGSKARSRFLRIAGPNSSIDNPRVAPCSGMPSTARQFNPHCFSKAPSTSLRDSICCLDSSSVARKTHPSQVTLSRVFRTPPQGRSSSLNRVPI